MTKQLIILVQLLGLFFYQLVFIGNLTVNQKVTTSKVGDREEFVVEIAINKDDVAGYAKLQQAIPAGFTAEPIETKGATFSFKANNVKFLWMALPADKEFTISYKLIPNESIKGNVKIGGVFSFILGDERKNIAVPETTFSVKLDNAISVENTDEEVAEETNIEEPLTLNTSSINCTRKIESIGNWKYKVTVDINKVGVEGFAKITEKIPAGFAADEGESNGGLFSFKDNKVKILWMAIPKGEHYTISYNLIVGPTVKDRMYSIKGDYSYLVNDVTSKYIIEASIFEYNGEEIKEDEPLITYKEDGSGYDYNDGQLADTEPETPGNSEVKEEIVEENLVAEELQSTSVEETYIAADPLAVTENKEAEPETIVNPKVEEDPIEEDVQSASVEETYAATVTSIPNPDNGITYKIQVGAGHKTVSSRYFAVRYNLQDNVSTINHEGWIKYLIGSYNDYKSARDKRNVVRKNIKDAFVTAYNSGTRITVQEALMISTQKWYK